MKRHTVMIIDDDVEFLEEMAEMLDSAGYRTLTAPTTERAIARIEESAPDIILLDIRMEGDGIVLARKLKENVGTSRIPIVVVSGCIGDDDFDDVMEQTGVREILTKPVTPQDIIASISTHLENPRDRS